MRTVTNKKIKFIFAGIIILLSTFNIEINFTAAEDGNILNIVTLQSATLQADDETTTCKWHTQQCFTTPITYREVCLSDGDGSSCTCGSVTRSCS